MIKLNVSLNSRHLGLTQQVRTIINKHQVRQSGKDDGQKNDSPRPD